MYKKSKTHGYVNGKESSASEQRNDLSVTDFGRNDSCITDKSTSLEGLDETDSWFPELISIRNKLSSERIKDKVSKYNLHIEKQLKIKEDNVSKYLENVQRTSDKHQKTKLKSTFERTNQKCSHDIDYFCRKKDIYLKRLQVLENHRSSLCIPPDRSSTNNKLTLNTSNSSKSHIFHKRFSTPHILTSTGGSVDVVVPNSDGSKNSKGLRSMVSHLAVESSKMTSFLLPNCKSKSVVDLSPRVEFKEFISTENDNTANFSNSIATRRKEETKRRKEETKTRKDVSRDFHLVKQKLKELTGNSDQLARSIYELRYKYESIHDDGKLLLEWQSKRGHLQMNMFNLLGRQHEEINSFKKELSSMEDEFELKVYEKSKEIQAAIENCQYQIFQLEHTSLTSNTNIVPDKSSTNVGSVCQLSIKAVNHLLTVVMAIFVVMATGASSLRYYQLNATWSQKVQASILVVCMIGTFIIFWNITWNFTWSDERKDEL